MWPGAIWWVRIPKTPPSVAPTNITLVNTPPEPPEASVIVVASIFRTNSIGGLRS